MSVVGQNRLFATPSQKVCLFLGAKQTKSGVKRTSTLEGPHLWVKQT